MRISLFLMTCFFLMAASATSRAGEKNTRTPANSPRCQGEAISQTAWYACQSGLIQGLDLSNGLLNACRQAAPANENKVTVISNSGLTFKTTFDGTNYTIKCSITGKADAGADGNNGGCTCN
jgi:hypothetical protein